ncbi:hypothetical protein A3762_12655 [Oleiphilus sp. HI0125]|uniref:hypothetical protein n=1 Tax=Oleiphilus sp. HI0125 TaxID=1822266 RepID=UPI0007C38EAB|nr:hypothetical protein [Oleiphilus sp. HI0125]KZZ63170.1 hypothetical protein A3762_12655 [Oleiphilus sp. HI0125]
MNEHRDNSNRLTFDFDNIEGEMYRKITDEVISNFSLEVATEKVAGFDEVFQDFKKGNDVIGLEWDNWSGYSVVAKITSAESLAKEIAGYINAKFNS